MTIKQLEELPRGEELGACGDAAGAQWHITGHQVRRSGTQRRREDRVILGMGRDSGDLHGQGLDTGVGLQSSEGSCDIRRGESAAEVRIGEGPNQLRQDRLGDHQRERSRAPAAEEFPWGALRPGDAQDPGGEDIGIEDGDDHAERRPASSDARPSAMSWSIVASSSATGTSAKAVLTRSRARVPSSQS